jgi:hypothetical protein
MKPSLLHNKALWALPIALVLTIDIADWYMKHHPGTDVWATQTSHTSSHFSDTPIAKARDEVIKTKAHISWSGRSDERDMPTQVRELQTRVYELERKNE